MASCYLDGVSSVQAPRRSPSPLRRVWLIALVVLGLCPGGYGFVQDAVHLVTDGHVVDAHRHNDAVAAHDDVSADANGHDDRAPGDEHGCSGTFHTCGCHAGAVYFVEADGPPELRLPLLLMRDSRFSTINNDASADVDGFDRPPRA